MKSRRLGIGVATGAGALALLAGAALAAPGDLDTTFSGDGKLVFDVADSGRADDVTVDAQGRIVVAGNVDPPGGGDSGDFAVARFLPDGTPDASFSGDGFLNLDPGTDDDADDGNALAIDSSGRIVVGGSDSGAATDVALIRLLDNGTLDSSFGGGDGRLLQDFAGGADVLNDLALDPSGNIVAAGTSSNRFLVARFSSAGSLDMSFGGGDGFETLDVNNVAGNDDHGTSMGIDSAGRILVAGYTALAVGQENFAVARFTPAGLLDTSFSNDVPTPGRNIVLMASETPGQEQDLAESLVIAPGDKPVAAGLAEIAGGEDVALVKLDVNGELDTSFSVDGKAYAHFDGSDRAGGLAQDASGRLVFTGRSVPAGSPAVLAVGRLLADGLPDETFSGDSRATADVGPADDAGQGIAIDPKTGRIVAAGYAGPFSGGEWLLARFEGVPRCGGQIPTIVGTPGKDKLKGTKGKDVISGGTGKDKILGLGGADVLCGEDGKDTLLGGGGKDRLLGGKGRDVLKGGKGKDKLKGGPGKDKQRQ